MLEIKDINRVGFSKYLEHFLMLGYQVSIIRDDDEIGVTIWTPFDSTIEQSFSFSDKNINKVMELAFKEVFKNGR